MSERIVITPEAFDTARASMTQVYDIFVEQYNNFLDANKVLLQSWKGAASNAARVQVERLADYFSDGNDMLADLTSDLYSIQHVMESVDQDLAK